MSDSRHERVLLGNCTVIGGVGEVAIEEGAIICAEVALSEPEDIDTR